MTEDRTKLVRNSLAILVAGTLSILGIYLSSLFLELELERKVDMDEFLFLPSIGAFLLVGAAIGWLAYYEDVKKIMWNFIVIVLIFGIVFPIAVGILVSRGQLDNNALANIILFPGSWFAAYIIHKSANYVASEHGHLSKMSIEEREKLDNVIKKLNENAINK